MHFHKVNNKLLIVNRIFKSRISIHHLPLTINRKTRGFTMIELLVAITIIGIISTIGYVNFDNARDKGRDSKRKQDLAAIKTALTSYYQDHDAYPPDLSNPNTEFPSDSTDDWIPDLASSYIQKLPKDPRQAGIFGALASLFAPKSQEPTQPQVAGATTPPTLDTPVSSGVSGGLSPSLTWQHTLVCRLLLAKKT